MSAWLVSKEHIVFMVESDVKIGDGSNNPEEMAAKANMLWEECLKSIKSRYPSSTETIPKIVAEEFLHFSPVGRGMSMSDIAQLAKSVNCYEYQSCEHEGWEKSEANGFCQSLRCSICDSLPGYSDAHWGGPNGE